MSEKVEDSIKESEHQADVQEIDLVKVNKSLHEEVQELKLALSKLKDEQNKLILATKVNTLKEQEIRNDDFKKYANQKVIKETIIPLLLEFERALNFKTENKDVKNFLIGFNHIFNNFKANLKSEGLEQITEKVGSPFDSSRNNVTEKIEILEETKDQKDSMIAEVVLSGYKLHDRVVSPVQVKIYQLQTENKNRKN
ncbi:nucleotide exchange factor GrpE [Spiroplasma platyhelix]|uniref:Nucleotide exchange factor GrpE n=1 Tax=Spiroplasma platyhelix PALS-1 TaxID=1276218 RepID=A0A846U0L0_9MOLU|nr:nucleotide exchange factor GrpE [Spiroplasma platyhelix]MBE4703993.1 Protein GrpE [Spiroplasma platyhelix PALS-1]NKE38366.1 nucleotide exchange factor GrpE [Spiroplasma platyhelix PALS-1]UJB29251.1 molecular chaperone GrpE (heat shock protein) [Spiroplasma platyhelix PALS-1]